MRFETLRKGVELIRKRDLSTLRRTGLQRFRASLSLVPDPITRPTRITPVGDGCPPRWLTSHETPVTYLLDDERYAVDSVGSGDGLEISDDVSTIEVPVVLPDHVDGIEITVASQIVESANTSVSLDLDEIFEMPAMMWVPVDCSEIPAPLSLTVDLDRKPEQQYTSHLSRWLDTRDGEIARSRVGLPSIVPETRQPPVILISVDTLRYDTHGDLGPLLEALGDDVVVPTEPRTQGNWTPPSHGSIFTGTHPGEHGYVGWGEGEQDERPLHPDLTTLGEFLTSYGYKSSALVSHGRILPEYGFGRGFHRFQLGQQHYSTWLQREHDVRAKVNQLCRWIDADIDIRDHSLFYFLHVFDPHYPYLPPRRYFEGDFDITTAAEYREAFSAVRKQADDGDFVQMATGDLGGVDDALVEAMRDYYASSVRYTADHLARLVRHLKQVGLFDDSLIIITGDHGEEFGERGFYTHTSLYDANIRPFMAVKPPLGASWTVRDEVDAIDILPTLARLVEADIPEHVSGIPLQEGDVDGRVRITERIRPDWYNVAVEADGTKGIFTFEENYPNRPDEATVAEEPHLEQFYDVSAVRSGEFHEADTDDETREKLRSLTREFVTSSRPAYTSERRVTISKETKEQLERLGYT